MIAKKCRESFHGNLCLDVGSGTGNIARWMTGMEVIACDLSKDMLKENLARHKVMCDACHLPFRNHVFSLITFYSVFHHLPDGKLALKEALRVSLERCILYIDHEPPLVNQRNKIRTAIRENLGFVLWCITKPKALARALEFNLIHRKVMQRLMENIDRELTDGNPVDINDIVLMLKANDFSVKLKEYGYGRLIEVMRGNNTQK